MNCENTQLIHAKRMGPIRSHASCPGMARAVLPEHRFAAQWRPVIGLKKNLRGLLTFPLLLGYQAAEPTRRPPQFFNRAQCCHVASTMYMVIGYAVLSLLAALPFTAQYADIDVSGEPSMEATLPPDALFSQHHHVMTGLSLHRVTTTGSNGAVWCVRKR